jgi:hypothetical protein
MVLRMLAGQIGPRSNRPQSNRPQVKSAPCYIYKIKWKYRLSSFSLMLRACWRSKNTNFYSLWFDISYRIEKWYSVCSECHSFDPRFLVAKLMYPMSINHWLWWIFVKVLKWIFNKGCRKNLGISDIWNRFVFTVFNRQYS